MKTVTRAALPETVTSNCIIYKFFSALEVCATRAEKKNFKVIRVRIDTPKKKANRGLLKYSNGKAGNTTNPNWTDYYYIEIGATADQINELTNPYKN